MTIDCLNINEVLKATGVSRSALYKLVKEGTFPKPIHVGKHARWRVVTIQKWMERQERQNEADQETIAALSA